MNALFRLSIIVLSTTILFACVPQNSSGSVGSSNIVDFANAKTVPVTINLSGKLCCTAMPPAMWVQVNQISQSSPFPIHKKLDPGKREFAYNYDLSKAPFIDGVSLYYNAISAKNNPEMAAVSDVEALLKSLQKVGSASSKPVSVVTTQKGNKAYMFEISGESKGKHQEMRRAYVYSSVYGLLFVINLMGEADSLQHNNIFADYVDVVNSVEFINN